MDGKSFQDIIEGSESMIYHMFTPKTASTNARADQLLYCKSFGGVKFPLPVFAYYFPKIS